MILGDAGMFAICNQVYRSTRDKLQVPQYQHDILYRLWAMKVGRNFVQNRGKDPVGAAEFVGGQAISCEVANHCHDEGTPCCCQERDDYLLLCQLS